MGTALAYLNDATLVTATSSVLEVVEQDDKVGVLLDSTIFYPQGGGQPYDQGTMECDGKIFQVHEVRFYDGEVYHYGTFDGARFEAGNQVTLKVDAARRTLHSKIHTAGHLVDVAMMNVGYDFEPTKGYHFPDSPYVEYNGVIEPEQREAAKQQLNNALAKLIASNETVQHKVVNTKAELEPLCPFVPDYIPEGKPIRVVTVAQNIGCPCGGTHVKQLSELNTITVHKIKAKNGHTRISYTTT